MKNVLYFVAAAAIIVILYWYHQSRVVRPETIRIMDSLYEAKRRIINQDSIEKAITKRVMDSVGPILTSQTKRLNLIQNENDRQRRANEKRFHTYDSIVLDRPDF